MTTVQVLCDDASVMVDLDAIRVACPPVLARFLGLNKDFEPPAKDTYGRLFFASEFGITQEQLTDVIIFLRTGHVNNDDQLLRTFTILGGCDKFDEIIREKDARRQNSTEYHEVIRQSKITNPMKKEDDVHDRFVFEPHEGDWPHTEEWECCQPVSPNNIVYWWRKKKEGI